MSYGIAHPDYAVRRLCELQTEVSLHLGCDVPADCFCFQERVKYDPDLWRNAGRSIAFIQYAVRDAIKRGWTAPEGWDDD